MPVYASYGGVSIFGTAVRMGMQANPSEVQLNTFFGVTGVFSLWGGGRGRFFPVEGLLVGSGFGDLAARVGAFLSFDDGVGRVLVDTGGVAWPAVVFTGQFELVGQYLYPPGLAVARAYRAVFRGNL
jgi:hypothetical protein